MSDAPTFQELAARLSEASQKRLMKIFNKFGEIDQAAINGFLAWAYEQGRVDGLTKIGQEADNTKARITAMFGSALPFK